ncbi:MAG: hypothetical protein DSZ29_08115 [Aquificaceae bacterium]|nr:MAG: hypothetical protein DSZ29_08115 [Aquificaceae bacterium]
MQTIISDITILRGIHHACFYKEGKVLATTFPAERQNAIALSCETIHKLFSTLGDRQKSHNELYFYLDDFLIIAYRIDENTLVVLSTDTNANHALAQMGVKSAIAKIEKLPPVVAPQNMQTSIKKKPEKLVVSMSTTEHIIIKPIPNTLFTQLKELLIDYLGPAATFIFKDHYTQWSKTHSVSMENITVLINMLVTELDSDDERADFLKKAKNLLNIGIF